MSVPDEDTKLTYYWHEALTLPLLLPNNTDLTLVMVAIFGVQRGEGTV